MINKYTTITKDLNRQQGKEVLDKGLDDIVCNLKKLIGFKEQTEASQLLLKDIKDIKRWYQEVIDDTMAEYYLRDYLTIDKRFNSIIELMSSKYIYSICLKTGSCSIIETYKTNSSSSK